VLETGLYLSLSGQSLCSIFLCQINHCVRDTVVSFFVMSINVLETVLYLSVLAGHCVRNGVVSFSIRPVSVLEIGLYLSPFGQ
jgi:hypothetical protein